MRTVAASERVHLLAILGALGFDRAPLADQPLQALLGYVDAELNFRVRQPTRWRA